MSTTLTNNKYYNIFVIVLIVLLLVSILSGLIRHFFTYKKTLNFKFTQKWIFEFLERILFSLTIGLILLRLIVFVIVILDIKLSSGNSYYYPS